MHKKTFKNSFTLIELIIVISLISLVSLILISNFNFKSFDNKKDIKLENIKEELLKKYEFEESLELVCIKKDYSCYLKKDNEYTKEVFKNLFYSSIRVYEYLPKDFEEIFYKNESIDTFEDRQIVFRYKINKDLKSKDLIVEFEDGKVLFFNSIYKKAKSFSSLNSFEEFIQENKNKVLNAF